MKVVIVMTYWNRQYQLNKTLLSFSRSEHTNFEVVVVDDKSDKPIVPILTSFPVTIIRVEDKKWNNPEPAYNIGLKHALTLKPDVIIVQNAECIHIGDVIKYATTVTDKTYIAFGCFSLDQENTFKEFDIEALTAAHQHRINISGQLGWYNHPRFRPNAFDFCVAVTAPNMKLLNGFDERFSDGYAMGDCDLVERVKKLGLKIEITERPFVAHQWHYDWEVPAYFMRLHAKNKLIFLELKKQKHYRAKHIYTNDL